MVSDLNLSLMDIPAVLLINFISATAILLLSDFFSAQVSYLYFIIGTTSVLNTLSLVFCCSLLHLMVLLISAYIYFSLMQNFISNVPECVEPVWSCFPLLQFCLLSFESHSFGVLWGYIHILRQLPVLFQGIRLWKTPCPIYNHTLLRRSPSSSHTVFTRLISSSTSSPSSATTVVSFA